jgi:hypothetical protein
MQIPDIGKGRFFGVFLMLAIPINMALEIHDRV